MVEGEKKKKWLKGPVNGVLHESVDYSPKTLDPLIGNKFFSILALA